jgi:hypothetical protein
MGPDLVSKIYLGTDLVFPSGFVLDAEAGAFSLFGQDLTFSRTLRLAAEAGVFALAGQDVSFDRTMRAEAGAFALAGQDAEFVKSILFPAEAGAFTLTGVDVGLIYQRLNLNAEPAAFALAGQDVNIFKTTLFSVEAGEFLLAGQDASLLRALSIAADPATYTLSGQSADLLYGRRLAADAAAFALTGVDMTFKRSLRLAAEAGSFALTGQAATLTYNSSVTLGSIGTVYESSADTNSYTATGLPSVGALQRGVILIGGRTTNGDPTISSVTIGGQAATHLGTAFNDSGSGNTRVAIYVGPVGASGNVVVNLTSNWNRVAIGVIPCSGIQSASNNGGGPWTDTDNPMSVSASCDAGGAIFAAAYSTASTTFAWTGLTERYDGEPEASNTVSFAASAFASAQSGLTIAATPGTVNLNAMVVVALK